MKKTIFAVSLIVVLAVIVSFSLITSVETAMSKDILVIIDAGHGEPDGGAVAKDGTKESDLNLSVAQKLYTYLTDSGIGCVMTRENVNGLGSTGKTIHQKKVYDTRNRVDIARKYSNAILVSIHMNTFTSESVSGMQVFYKKNSCVAKSIANEIQNCLNIKFQSDNPKDIKAIPSNIYLFNNIDNDSILVECGFLTNSNDLNNLKNEQYQSEIAKAISEILIYKL